jgi:hypothetical protein
MYVVTNDRNSPLEDKILSSIFMWSGTLLYLFISFIPKIHSPYQLKDREPVIYRYTNILVLYKPELLKSNKMDLTNIIYN